MSRSNSFPVTCPQCGAELAATSGQIGTKITCSDCLEEFTAQASAELSPESSPLAAPTGGSTGSSASVDEGALQRLLNPDLDEEEPASETIRLDDDLGEDAGYARFPKPNVPTKGYEFGIQCHLCGTRLNMTDAEIGKVIPCPDCHTELTVREPPPSGRKAKTSVPAVEDDGFRLAGQADVETAAPFQSIASDLLKQVEAESAPAATIRPVATDGDDSLRRAEEELTEEEAKEPPLPPSPFSDRFFNFLLDPNTIGRLVFFAIALFILLGVVQLAVATTEEGPIAQFISVLMRMFGVIYGLFFLGAFCTGMQGILQDTSCGMDEIESWPDINFLDWFGEMLYIASSLFVCIVPTFLLAKLAGESESAFWGTILVVGSLGLIFIFPFVLLSMLESSSPVNPLSRPIQRSLGLARGRWIQFAILAAVVVSMGAALVVVRARWPDWTALNLAIASGFVLLAAIYFRLLGRLAWCCRIAVADDDTRLAELLAEQES